MPFGFDRRYRHLQRYRQIGETFLRHGFGYLIQQLDLAYILPPGKRIRSLRPVRESHPVGTRLRRVLEELGPTYVKFGQLLSTRADLVPPAIISELEKLQDQVPPSPFGEIRDQVEQQLGVPLEKAFSQFDERPLAAASIGQVHHATLPDGQEVVVKVQRPRIQKTIQTDLEILFYLARLLADRLNHKLVDPVELVEEFARVLNKELDYSREGRNIERFRQNFRGVPDVIVPKVFWHLSSERVLTMEYIHGYKLREVKGNSTPPIDRVKVANTAARALLKQIFEDGFFHGDPHPGNLLICPDGRIAFVDFGLVGRVDQTTMQALARLLVAITRQDVETTVEILNELEAFSGKPTRQFRNDLRELIDYHYGKTLKELNFSQISEDLFALARKHPLRFPPDLLLLTKALATAEGVGAELVPDFNVMEVAEPFAQKWISKYYSPGELVRRSSVQLNQWAKLVNRIPKDFDSVLNILNKGELEIRFRHEGLEKLINRLDIIANRLTFSIIIAALIIGSSFIMMVDQGPHFMQFPVVGLLGFVLAGFFGIWLLISIWRSGRF